MAWRALRIVEAMNEAIVQGSLTIEQAVVDRWLRGDENLRELVIALPAALAGADHRVVDLLQKALNNCNIGYVDLQKNIDDLANNIEPGDTQHGKRRRF